MDYYISRLIFDDPVLGKTARAYIKRQVGVDQFAGELLTLDDIHDALDKNRTKLQEIDNGTASEWATQHRSIYADNVVQYEEAREALRYLHENYRLNKGDGELGNFPGIFHSDGFAVTEIPEMDAKVFTILRQKRALDNQIVRRVIDVDTLRQLHKSVAEDMRADDERAGRAFPADLYKKAAALLQSVLEQAEFQEDVRNRRSGPDKVDPGWVPR